MYVDRVFFNGEEKDLKNVRIFIIVRSLTTIAILRCFALTEGQLFVVIPHAVDARLSSLTCFYFALARWSRSQSFVAYRLPRTIVRQYSSGTRRSFVVAWAFSSSVRSSAEIVILRCALL